MIIQSISPEIDVIISNVKQDINSLSLTQLIDQIELDNSLYFFERQKRTQRRLSKQNNKPIHIFQRLLTAVL